MFYLEVLNDRFPQYYKEINDKINSGKNFKQ